ncbi:hypothetical protein BLD50_09200 [Bacillus cereus]|nr:hypothetical protein BLD50_09200 [Bacillus cereus]
MWGRTTHPSLQEFRLFLKLKARYYSLMLMRKGDVLFMNMHQKQELSLFAEELYRYMSPATLNQFAIEAGGMKRKHKCLGHHFLSTLCPKKTGKTAVFLGII